MPAWVGDLGRHGFACGDRMAEEAPDERAAVWRALLTEEAAAPAQAPEVWATPGALARASTRLDTKRSSLAPPASP